MKHLFRYLQTRLGQLTSLGIVGLSVLLGSTGNASAQVTTASATTFKGIKMVRGADATTTNSTDWADLPGAVVYFPVSPGQTFQFVTHFTAESVCFGTNGGWCPVRVLVNGQEASPVVGYDFAFDSNDSGNASSAGWKSHAVDRSVHYTNTGTGKINLPIKVQYVVTDPSISFRLDDWQFTVEQYQ
jgi:hypothetical protein